MVRIVSRVVRANECDTLLQIAEQQLILKDSALTLKDSALVAKDSVITSKESIILLKEDIIVGKEQEISDLRAVLKKDKRRIKWLKIGWATTAVGLTATTLYFMTK